MKVRAWTKFMVLRERSGQSWAKHLLNSAEVFCCLPLAHVINSKIFVVHAELFSVGGMELADVQAIDHFCEPPEEGILQALIVKTFYS